MEDYLTSGQRILVKVEELEAFLLCPTDVTGVVNVLAENACNQEGYRRVVFIDARSVCKKLQLIIDYMNVKQGGGGCWQQWSENKQ